MTPVGLADEIVRKLDRFRLSASPVINIAHRVKKLDEVAQAFLNRHPEAVALDLGAGLDTRMFRIAVPATVDWYDVDFPEVISARQRRVPERVNAHRVGTDLADQRWVEVVPKGLSSTVSRSGRSRSTATPGSPSGQPSTTTERRRSPT